MKCRFGHPRRAVLSAVLIALTAPVSARAQVRASERGGAWQTVDGTTIRVEYGRPAARGRTLFGGLIHWGEVWTPGANWATTLAVDHDVRINDTPVPAGEYSVWVIPQPEGWTFNLDAKPDRFHTQKPDTTKFVVRIPVTPLEGEQTERLTFDFEDFQRSGTTLRMHWGDTVLPLAIRVRSTLATAPLTTEEMAPYLGHYTTKIYGQGPPDTFPLEMYDAGGRIRGRGGVGRDFIELIPTDEPNVFRIGMLRDGEIFDVEHVLLTFTMADGRATGFHVPGEGIPIWMEAERQ